MPSLNDMRAKPPASRLERTFDVVLDAVLVRRVADLAQEAQALGVSTRPADKVRYAEVLTEMEALAPQVEAASGALTLRANLTSGEWRNFVDENPPRPEGQPGHERDKQRTGAMVNADALIDNLDRFAQAWDGETLQPTVRDKDGTVLTEGDFDTLLRDSIAPGDLAEMAEAVVLMYETSPDFGRWRSALPAALQRLRDFAVPESSGSPLSGTTAGSPESSIEGSTETETPAS